MKRILSGCIRQTVILLIVCALMVSLMLIASGRPSLIGALFVGYLVAAVYLSTTAMRVWRSMTLTSGAAKREMLWGFILRLVIVFLVFGAALRISTAVFGMMVVGFFICYVIMMACLIKKNISA